MENSLPTLINDAQWKHAMQLIADDSHIQNLIQREYELHKAKIDARVYEIDGYLGDSKTVKEQAHLLDKLRDAENGIMKELETAVGSKLEEGLVRKVPNGLLRIVCKECTIGDYSLDSNRFMEAHEKLEKAIKRRLKELKIGDIFADENIHKVSAAELGVRWQLLKEAVQAVGVNIDTPSHSPTEVGGVVQKSNEHKL